MKSFKHLFGVVPDCHTSGGYYRLLWRRHIYDGIRPLVDRLVTPEDLDFSWARRGHDLALDPNQPERLETSEKLWTSIKRAHENRGLDAVISYCFTDDLEPEVVRNTQALGVPWINFYCDSTHMFSKVEALARLVSLNWFPESAAIPRYTALGVPHLCAPFAMNPDRLPDLNCRNPEHPVAFIGLPTTNRITLLGCLRLHGCRTTIRGNGWLGENADPFYNPAPRSSRFLKALFQPNLGEKLLRRALWPTVRKMAAGPLPDEEFNSFVRSCQVMLGLNQGKDAEGRFESYLKFRDVEFPGYGCCYVTEHNPDVERVFEVGREVLTYRGMREAAEQIKRVRKEPGRAASIGKAARERVLREHVWARRLEQLANSL
ncbi:MAG: glycosyltransferase [Verrucomicrobia bacterium]|nr:glycosyltransferase [Verrucomicrobiota bacterium]